MDIQNINLYFYYTTGYFQRHLEPRTIHKCRLNMRYGVANDMPSTKWRDSKVFGTKIRVKLPGKQNLFNWLSSQVSAETFGRF